MVLKTKPEDKKEVPQTKKDKKAAKQAEKDKAKKLAQAAQEEKAAAKLKRKEKAEDKGKEKALSEGLLRTKGIGLKESGKKGLENASYSLWRKSPEMKAAVKERIDFLTEWFFPGNWEDGEFMDDVRQSTLRGANPASNLLFWAIFTFISLMLIWAGFAEIDEVTRGDGKVIPSSQVQVVQNLEGGIVGEILVREGELVDKGQVLIRIDDTGFASSFNEKKAKLESLRVAIPRMEAEISGEEIVYPEDAPEYVILNDMAVYESRKEELNNSVGILRRQLEQKQQMRKEADTNYAQSKRAYELKNKEYKMTLPLLKEGVVSEVEMLGVEQELNALKGELEAAEIAIPQAESAMEEARERMQEVVVKFRTETLRELAEKKEELARLTEVMKAVGDQVARTTVRAPVKGTVKRMLVNTLGGVVEPGMDLVELIPLEDTLLVQAQIRPKDIAFLRPGQKAMVKISAYDYSIYGGLEATLENIGIDTVTDERGNAFYEIKVRTNKSELEHGGESLPIISGMIATVDILTGKKTVLDYILKPFIKMRDNALRER